MELSAEMVANIYKINYAKLSPSLNALRESRDKVCLVMDLGKILDSFYAIYHRKQMNVTDRQKKSIAMAILGIMAHYRHFYHDNLRMSNSIILYCSKQEQYTKYSDILGVVKTVVDVVPSTIYIVPTEVQSEDPEFYRHVAMYTLNQMNKMCETQTKKLHIHVLSYDPMHSLFFAINPDVRILWTQSSTIKIMDCREFWLRIVSDEDERIKSYRQDYELRSLLFPYLVANRVIKGYEDIPKPIQSKPQDKLDVLFESIKRFRRLSQVSVCQIYLRSVYDTDEKYERAFSAIRSVKFYGSPEVKQYIKLFNGVMTKKIKDPALSVLSALVEMTNSSLNPMWLTENKGV